MGSFPGSSNVMSGCFLWHGNMITSRQKMGIKAMCLYPVYDYVLNINMFKQKPSLYYRPGLQCNLRVQSESFVHLWASVAICGNQTFISLLFTTRCQHFVITNCNLQIEVGWTVICSDWSWFEKYFEDLKSVSTYKSSKIAAELRGTGNKYFQKKDFRVALQYYNQVVYCMLHYRLIFVIPMFVLLVCLCIFRACCKFDYHCHCTKCSW